jgi:hypothetical protein
MLHVYPAQQSLDEVQTPPAATHFGPVGVVARHRSVPIASGTHGTPPQHSDANEHCCPAWMQQGATPVYPVLHMAAVVPPGVP